VLIVKQVHRFLFPRSKQSGESSTSIPTPFSSGPTNASDNDLSPEEKCGLFTLYGKSSNPEEIEVE
jgi:hypothetical protein